MIKQNVLETGHSFSNFKEYEGVGSMFITTVGRADKETIILAKRLAEKLQYPLYCPKKTSSEISNGTE